MKYDTLNLIRNCQNGEINTSDEILVSENILDVPSLIVVVLKIGEPFQGKDGRR